MYLFYKNLEAKKVEIEYQTKKLGGSYPILERFKLGGIGVGGLKYVAGLTEIDKVRTYEDTIVCSLEVLKKAFAIRFRNIQFHSLLLMDLTEIEQIKLTKSADELSLNNRSLFRYLLKKEVDYETARMFATPAQLVKIGKVELTIKTKAHEMTFENLDGFSGKLSRFFQHSHFKNFYTEDIQPFNLKQQMGSLE